ncbi:Ig-like domain-containing protein [Archangium violaceum]|uniref:Ig-like domain-containing protein n=1 Tax=Archangium violaceum TaxID=83451 RepID=UPI001951F241|nr:Ig-like domain-containing protein [Archangium violaceum]QRN98107.1 Ig-like domain-containing protein [Archangium violaceum]
MNLARPLSPLLAVLTAGCIVVPEVETAPREVNLVIQGDSGEGPVHTRGPDVSVSVGLQGVTPNLIELLVDGRSEARLEPPDAYTWDTRTLTEGAHELQLQAIDRGELLVSPSRTVVLDRTAPAIAQRKPAPGSSVARDSIIQAEFSEPLEPSTVNADTVRLWVNELGQQVQAELSSDGKVLTVRTRYGLPPSGPAQLQLNGVTDLVGNPVLSSWGWNYP